MSCSCGRHSIICGACGECVQEHCKCAVDSKPQINDEEIAGQGLHVALYPGKWKRAQDLAFANERKDGNEVLPFWERTRLLYLELGGPMTEERKKLGTCETPHFLGQPTPDRTALTQIPHYELPNNLCRNWREQPAQAEPRPKCPTCQSERTELRLCMQCFTAHLIRERGHKIQYCRDPWHDSVGVEGISAEPTALSYEQEVHALLYAAAANTEDLIRYFEAQAAQENGETKKLTEKCIEWKRYDLQRFRALIPQALKAQTEIGELRKERDALKLDFDKLTEEWSHLQTALTKEVVDRERAESALAEARNKALDEAIAMCEHFAEGPLTPQEWPKHGLCLRAQRFDNGTIGVTADNLATAIRALKEKASEFKGENNV